MQLFTLDGHTVNVTQPYNVSAVTKKVLSRFSVVYEGKLNMGFQIFFLEFREYLLTTSLDS